MDFKKAVLTEKIFENRLVLDGRHENFFHCRYFDDKTKSVLCFAIPKNLSETDVRFFSSGQSISRALFRLVVCKNAEIELTVDDFSSRALSALRFLDLLFWDLDQRIFTTPKFSALVRRLHAAIGAPPSDTPNVVGA